MTTGLQIVVFGELPAEVRGSLETLILSVDGLLVGRDSTARSSTPFPKSTDLELALKPVFEAAGFLHHHDLHHPTTGDRFEYDFWRPADGVAMEVMAYRADDEVYKDILKFHVHGGTQVGVVWVPRWKWISGKRTETNCKATMKALAFADSHMAVKGLVAVTYDWAEEQGGLWKLVIVE